MKKSTFYLTALSLLGCLLAASSQAADVWWHQVPANAAQDNGSVTLLDANGNPTNMVVNPTAAAVTASRAASTQPPTVIVQATTGYWKDPVTNVSDLPTTGNSVGDVRMVTSTAKPYMWDGTKWAEQSSDYSGTVSVGNLQVKNVAVEGSACSPNGLVAVNATGLLLSCQDGMWKEQLKADISVQYTAVTAPGVPLAQTSMGKHKFCALTYIYQTPYNRDQSQCSVSLVGTNWILGAFIIATGDYMSCAATCFD